MNVYPIRPDPNSNPHPNRDSLIVLLATLAIFVIVAAVDIICSMRFWATAHDVASTFAPLNTTVIMLLGFVLGATVTRFR